MPKRKRRSTAAASGKRAKVGRNPFRLLDLPVEIQDQILETILHFPEFREDDCSNEYTIAHVLASSILSTSVSLQRRGLKMIQDEFAWIRFGCSLPNAWTQLQCHDCYSSRVPSRLRRLIEPNVTTLDIFFGFDTPTATADRFISSPKSSIMFPFTHKTWIEFLASLQVRGQFGNTSRASSLAICCDAPSPAMTRILRPHVVPGILAIRQLNGVGFHGNVFNDIKPDEIAEMKANRWECDDFDDLMQLFDRIAVYEADGKPECGAHLALYSFPRLRTCMFSFLIRPEFWEEDRIKPDQASVRNNIAQLFFSIEDKAMMRFDDLYHCNGVKWALNHQFLTSRGSRWTEDIYDAVFSLRQVFRAKAHLVIAFSLQLNARMEAGLEPHENDQSLLRSDESYAEAIRIADMHLQVAQRLLGQGEIKSSEFRFFDHEDTSVLGKPVDEQYVAIHKTGETSFFWAGHKGLLQAWGGRRVLQYLPLAKESLLEPESQTIIAGPEVISDAKYCGQKCNCIVF